MPRYPLAFLLVTVLLLTTPVPGLAQAPAGTLAQLAVDLWPDYDRPAVLVLLTGTLPADTPLPATVTLPFPAEATLNAVARITGDNNMVDDVSYDTTNGQLTLTTPDLRFRVEYYLPYTEEAGQRTFTFAWQDGPAVAELAASVQQPAAASELATTPAAESVTVGQDTLRYHNLPIVSLPAGAPYTLEVR
ncbi:MAG: hypothetical protein L0322_19675, partial [Chloroflexi bacterium]|nr:hypothetical protein [Chloroflexota bacterium]